MLNNGSSEAGACLRRQARGSSRAMTPVSRSQHAQTLAKWRRRRAQRKTKTAWRRQVFARRRWRVAAPEQKEKSKWRQTDMVARGHSVVIFRRRVYHLAVRYRSTHRTGQSSGWRHDEITRRSVRDNASPCDRATWLWTVHGTFFAAGISSAWRINAPCVARTLLRTHIVFRKICG